MASVRIAVALPPALSEQTDAQEAGDPENPDDDHQCDTEITHHHPR